MKTFILILCLSGLCLTANAQYVYKQPKDRLAVLDKDFGVYYFHIFPYHAMGTVYLKNGQEASLRMNYDMENGFMSFVKEDHLLGVLVTDNIKWIDVEPFILYPVGEFFGELIARGYGYELLICRKIRRKVPRRDSYGTIAQSASADVSSASASRGRGHWIELSGVDPETVDYIKIDDFHIRYQEETYEMNDKTIRKLFPDRYDLIKAFIKEHKLKYDRYEDAYEIFRFCIGME